MQSVSIIAYTSNMTTKKKAMTRKQRAPRKAVSHKVDYYPNRMTFWVSAAAGSLIVLVALICAYNR